MAVKKVKEYIPAFDIKNFKMILVRKRAGDVYVAFRNPILFIPLNSFYIYEVAVFLVTDTISWDKIDNPPGYGEKFEKADIPPIFVPNEETEQAIAQVLDIINREDSGVGSIPNNILPKDSFMKIIEHQDYYNVEMNSPTVFSTYKIKKDTGEIYDHRHEHLVPDDLQQMEPETDVE